MAQVHQRFESGINLTLVPDPQSTEVVLKSFLTRLRSRIADDSINKPCWEEARVAGEHMQTLYHAQLIQWQKILYSKLQIQFHYGAERKVQSKPVGYLVAIHLKDRYFKFKVKPFGSQVKNIPPLETKKIYLYKISKQSIHPIFNTFQFPTVEPCALQGSRNLRKIVVCFPAALIILGTLEQKALIYWSRATESLVLKLGKSLVVKFALFNILASFMHLWKNSHKTSFILDIKESKCTFFLMLFHSEAFLGIVSAPKRMLFHSLWAAGRREQMTFLSS